MKENYIKINVTKADLKDISKYEETLQEDWYMSTDSMTKSQIVYLAKFLEYGFENNHEITSVLAAVKV